METEAALEQSEKAAPAAAVPTEDEQTLKAVRLAKRYVSRKTEAVIVIQKGGEFTLLDMQAPGKFLLSTSPINERWRETIRKPITQALVVTTETVYPPKQATPAPATPPKKQQSAA